MSNDEPATPTYRMVWDGLIRSVDMDKQHATRRHRLADAAKRYDWPAVLALIGDDSALVNSVRPDGQSHYAPLHQAAYGGAPLAVVEQLLHLGAWRALRTAGGEQPVELARRRGHTHLLAVLEPPVPPIAHAQLAAIEQHLHALIRERATSFAVAAELRLPALEPVFERAHAAMWFGVPGMYGGFSIEPSRDHRHAAVVVSSWSRIVGGSGERHVVSAYGYLLVEEGFV